MIYQLEKYADIVNELNKLLPSFYKEVDIYPESPEPNINHDELNSLDELKILQVVTAREGKLVGFHISAIRYDIFYTHILTGYVMFYYLLAENRGHGNGTGMFEFADKNFKEKSVERIFISRKIYMPNEKMFDYLGYKQLEAGYTKHIGS